MPSAEQYVLRGPPLSVPAVEISSGRFLYERLSNNTEKGIALVSHK